MGVTFPADVFVGGVLSAMGAMGGADDGGVVATTPADPTVQTNKLL